MSLGSASFFYKAINTFIQQGSNKSIKCNFNMATIFFSIHQRILNQTIHHGLHKKYLSLRHW